jgi:hypothetical protein
MNAWELTRQLHMFILVTLFLTALTVRGQNCIGDMLDQYEDPQIDYFQTYNLTKCPSIRDSFTIANLTNVITEFPAIKIVITEGNPSINIVVHS